MRLHHVALGARDVELLAHFYATAFELREVARHHEGERLRSVWLELGPACCLMIERTEQPAPELVSGVGSGPFLLAFRIGEAERAACERSLEELGSRIEERSPFSSYARDPEGNRVAVSFHPLEPEP